MPLANSSSLRRRVKSYNSINLHNDRPSRFLVDLPYLLDERSRAAEPDDKRGFNGVLRRCVRAIKADPVVPKKKKSHAHAAALAAVFVEESGTVPAAKKPRRSGGFEQASAPLVTGGSMVVSAPVVVYRRLAFYPLFRAGFLSLSLIVRYLYYAISGAGWLTVSVCRLAGRTAAALFTAVNSARKTPDAALSSFRPPEDIFFGSESDASEELNQSSAGQADAFRADAEDVLCMREQENAAPARVVAALTPAGRTRRLNCIFAWLRIYLIAAALGRMLSVRSRPKSLKPALYFAILLVMIITPFKAYLFYTDMADWRGRVLGASEAAVDEMIGAAGSATQQDFGSAREGFALAEERFRDVRADVGAVSRFFGLIAPIVRQKDIRLAAQADRLLAAGEMAADLGDSMSGALEEFLSAPDRNLATITGQLTLYLGNWNRQVGELAQAAEAVDTDILPPEYASQFAAIKDKTALAADSLKEFERLFAAMKLFLAFENDRRYLLVFQNNAELRASGGFIGSFAVIDFRNGAITRIDAPGGGSYDTEAGLRVRVTAPEPLWLVNPLWHFWDANWWPDWPTTAKKLMWFYEKSDGPTVDGVISLTPAVMEDVLRVTGPIELGEPYNLVLTEENFWQEIQALSERKPDETVTPKEVIGDALAVIMEELPKRLDKPVLAGLLKSFESNLAQKHILAYFNDERLQSEVVRLGYDGAVLPAKRDYLQVVNTNIAGGKSDRLTKEKISHRAEIGLDGSVIDTVRIERTHTGAKGEQFTGVRNVDWLRVYVPAGSELIAAEGFSSPDPGLFETPEDGWQDDPDVAAAEGRARVHEESGTKIYEESGKTVFANWLMFDPGETGTVYLRYRLPFRLGEINGDSPAGMQNFLPYSLLVQKQPGSAGSTFLSDVLAPTNYSIAWKYPETLNTTECTWHAEDTLDADKYWAVLLEEK